MSFGIHVTTLAGRTIVVEVDAVKAIRDVKKKIQEVLDIPWFEQKLLYGTQQLDDNDKTLYDYNVYNHTPLCVWFTLIHMDYSERFDVQVTVYKWPGLQGVSWQGAGTGTITWNDNLEFRESLGRHMPAAVFLEVLRQHAPWATFVHIWFTADLSLDGFTCLDDFIRAHETVFWQEFRGCGNRVDIGIQPDPASEDEP